MAQRMTHYMDDDTTVLEMPAFTSLDPQLPVDVNALRAQISTDGKQVYFLKQVRVRRAGQDGQAPAMLDTEYLHISPDERIMRTNQFVTLRQGASVITANQLLIDDIRQVDDDCPVASGRLLSNHHTAPSEENQKMRVERLFASLICGFLLLPLPPVPKRRTKPSR
jgi:hypothetical protein